jgi:hypothetical protein
MQGELFLSLFFMITSSGPQVCNNIHHKRLFSGGRISIGKKVRPGLKLLGRRRRFLFTSENQE